MMVIQARLAPPLAAFGDWLRAHQAFVRRLQWGVVVVYLALLLIPAVLPLPAPEARALDHITVFAQFIFWGLWWPFVLLSMVLVGRVWCGVFCPEGALSEWASTHGRGGAVPRWMKWGGWPFVAFCLTTVYGQLVSVYQYPKAAALVLGGSTVAAVAIGYLYGKSKRVWCKHLCPVNGVFALLARLSPLHYRVDRAAWDAPPTRKVIPINCAPLVDIRRMQGAAECHACGRCSGQRDAVALSLRAPNAEIATLSAEQASGWDLLLIVYGLLGVALGAFQWTGSPWFIDAKQAVAEWLVAHDWLWPLEGNAPWWLLTHYPEHHDVFSWLDGAMVVAYITATALVLGTWLLLWLGLAARILSGSWRGNLYRLAYSLVPLAGCGVFIGLSALTFTLLKAEGWSWSGLNAARYTLLFGASGWTFWLASRQAGVGWRRFAVPTLLLPGILTVLYLWWLQFEGWHRHAAPLF